ncbi:MAG TPA: nuclear transport factor 2 family protein [Actinomycetes bacterium]|jgi:ketosteroid isomerase-like protein|nr:nuclear transport factor 2 family protein [Actinomycetes bacterium]
MSPADVFRAYLERFTSGDVDGAAELLADEFSFNGPILQAAGKAEFLAGSGTAAAIARGCHIHRQWVDGDEVCSIYDFAVETPAGAGSIPMAEWCVVRDGRLVSSRLLFDTAAMAALMTAS